MTQPWAYRPLAFLVFPCLASMVAQVYNRRSNSVCFRQHTHMLCVHSRIRLAAMQHFARVEHKVRKVCKPFHVHVAQSQVKSVKCAMQNMEVGDSSGVMWWKAAFQISHLVNVGVTWAKLQGPSKAPARQQKSCDQQVSWDQPAI